jgi:hypothetical protein
MLKLAPCGDDCNFCPRYLATQSGDEEQLKEASLLWQIVGWRDVDAPLEDMKCNGCATLETCPLGFIECVRERNIDNCGECPDYACERMEKIFENNIKEAVICREKFTEKDYDLFRRAFWDKKERLDEIHREYTG